MIFSSKYSTKRTEEEKQVVCSSKKDSSKMRSVGSTAVSCETVAQTS